MLPHFTLPCLECVESRLRLVAPGRRARRVTAHLAQQLGGALPVGVVGVVEVAEVDLLGQGEYNQFETPPRTVGLL